MSYSDLLFIPNLFVAQPPVAPGPALLCWTLSYHVYLRRFHVYRLLLSIHPHITGSQLHLPTFTMYPKDPLDPADQEHPILEADYRSGLQLPERSRVFGLSRFLSLRRPSVRYTR